VLLIILVFGGSFAASSSSSSFTLTALPVALVFDPLAAVDLPAAAPDDDPLPEAVATVVEAFVALDLETLTFDTPLASC
jgi:hypothetical protein